MRKNREKQKGFGTVELVILTAILIGLAILFKTFIVEYASNTLENIREVEINVEDIGS